MSTGLYTHITRAPGTIVTAPLYNGSHQNHLNNDIPTSAGAHSDTLAQFRATTDPAPAGVAAPVADVGTELEQYRFVLADIKTTLNGGTPPAQWYTPIATPAQTSVPGFGARVSVLAATQSIPVKTSTPITFDNVRYDTSTPAGPFFAGGTPTRLTARVAGIYEIGGFGTWTTGPSTGPLALTLRLNGVTTIAAQEYGIDGINVQHGMTVNTQYRLGVGDYVELVAFQNSTSNPLALLNPEMWIHALGLQSAVQANNFGVLVVSSAAIFVPSTVNPLFSLSAPPVRSAVAGDVQTRMPQAGSFTTLSVLISGTVTGGGTATINFVVNGVVQSGIQLVLASGASSGTATGVVSFAIDDLVHLQVVFAGGTTTLNCTAITIAYTSPNT